MTILVGLRVFATRCFIESWSRKISEYWGKNLKVFLSFKSFWQVSNWRFVKNLENYNKRLHEIEKVQHQKLCLIKERAARRDFKIAETQFVAKQNQIKYEKFDQTVCTWLASIQHLFKGNSRDSEVGGLLKGRGSKQKWSKISWTNRKTLTLFWNAKSKFEKFEFSRRKIFRNKNFLFNCSETVRRLSLSNNELI